MFLCQSSVFECEKWRHANCQWEEGGAGMKRWRRGFINTHPQAHTHSNKAVPNLTAHPVSRLVPIKQFFFLKRDHIGGWLLCSSTSAQWWHHSVWDRDAIFSLRQWCRFTSIHTGTGTTDRDTGSVVEGQSKLALDSMTCSFFKKKEREQAPVLLRCTVKHYTI